MTDHHRFTAAACRSAAGIWDQSESAAQRNFAPTLRAWACNADRRADQSQAGTQPDLFTGARND